MTWEDLLTLLVDTKKTSPEVMQDSVTAILDNERWKLSLSEDMVSGKMNFTPAFSGDDDEDEEDAG
jgi:hypothetical protein